MTLFNLKSRNFDFYSLSANTVGYEVIHFTKLLLAMNSQPGCSVKTKVLSQHPPINEIPYDNTQSPPPSLPLPAPISISEVNLNIWDHLSNSDLLKCHRLELGQTFSSLSKKFVGSAISADHRLCSKGRQLALPSAQIHENREQMVFDRLLEN